MSRIAFRITKATNTQTEYVTLIPFPLQQWAHERVSMLRYATLFVLFLYKRKKQDLYLGDMSSLHNEFGN